MSFSKIRLEFSHENRIARITLAAAKANIVDRAMTADLDRAFAECEQHKLHAVVLAAEGPHFSFGASVHEHLPEFIAGTLEELHGLLRRITRANAPVIAAVRGQCLGGGFELVLACDLIIAEATALFAAPEIKLGVFPPAASALLPLKLGSAAAANAVLTGCGMTGEFAAQFGLVSRTVAAGALETELAAWLETDFLPRSADALRCAAIATRRRIVQALDCELTGLERLYLDDLMSSPDASEGIRAFLEKRAPRFARSTATAS